MPLFDAKGRVMEVGDEVEAVANPYRGRSEPIVKVIGKVTSFPFLIRMLGDTRYVLLEIPDDIPHALELYCLRHPMVHYGYLARDNTVGEVIRRRYPEVLDEYVFHPKHRQNRYLWGQSKEMTITKFFFEPEVYDDEELYL